MNRQQKEAVIVDLKAKLHESPAAFVVNYRGLSVVEMQSLRRKLRNAQAQMNVAKARLMKIATRDIAGADALNDYLHDQIALVFAQGEVPVVAKEITSFANEHEALQIIAGFFESRILTQEQVKMLSELPSREVLLAQLAGTLQAPMAGLVRVLNMLLVKLVLVLKEIENKQQGASAK